MQTIIHITNHFVDVELPPSASSLGISIDGTITRLIILIDELDVSSPSDPLTANAPSPSSGPAPGALPCLSGCGSSPKSDCAIPSGDCAKAIAGSVVTAEAEVIGVGTSGMTWTVAGAGAGDGEDDRLILSEAGGTSGPVCVSPILRQS